MAAVARATTPTTEPAAGAPDTPTSLSSTTLPIAPTKAVTPVGATVLSAAPASSPSFLHKVLSPRPSPRPLTGAIALADAQRAEEQQRSQAASRYTSPNPRFTAVNALLGHQEISKASYGPPTTQISEPLQHAISKIVVPVPVPSAPTSAPGTGTTDTASPTAQGSSANGPAAMTATAPPRHSVPQLVEEPESMDEEGAEDDSHITDEQTRPFTYPGPPGSAMAESSRRDLSYDSGAKGTAKRHKCPYCATDFTRHHNLKSHLLTHSQEKPYVCQTCSARFRRLHDLKRHSKLHTGERPHICPKCGRKFARGDALARHNKGPGGCANRKSSFGGEDGEDGMDDTMDGLEYDNDQGDDLDEDDIAEAQARRVSEPNRKRPRQDTAMDDVGPYRQPSTYPPPQMTRVTRPDTQAMGPPPSVLSPNTRMPMQEHNQMGHQHMDHQQQPQYYPQAGGTTYSLPHVTESPRPLSPRSQEQQRMSIGDASALRNRSPSVNNNNFQTQQYGRGSVSGMAPHAHMIAHAPQLPSLGSLAAPHQNVQASMSNSYPGNTFTQPAGSNPGSHSSHGHSSSGSLRDILGSEPADLMSYIRNLEQRFSRMQDEYELRISRLQSDVIELKKQVYKG